MGGFSNLELRNIRDNLTCGHCNCTFIGTDSQARKVKYEKQTVYCSDICRKSGKSAKVRKEVPTYGPCPTCGNMFSSKTSKQFCSIDCYVVSDKFRKMQTKNLQVLNTQEHKAKMKIHYKRLYVTVACMECGTEKTSIASKPQKFCCRPCYRSYMAKRFDRWIANPERMALPQCYDEFLDQEELPCLIEGCTWHGKGLTLHVNFTHGILAADFKRAAGFNLSSGIISKDLAVRLSQRENIGVGLKEYDRSKFRNQSPDRNVRSYISKEHIEHLKKSRTLFQSDSTPERQCLGCGSIFQQSTPFGRALYCTPKCRDETYSKQRKAITDIRGRHHRHQNKNGTFRWEKSNG